MRAKIGEVYCFRLHGGGYGAIQVVAENQDRKSPGVQLIRLDIDTDEPPSAQQVDAAQTLHHGKDLYGTWVPPLGPLVSAALHLLPPEARLRSGREPSEICRSSWHQPTCLPPRG